MPDTPDKTIGQEMLDDLRLEELRRLYEAATPGEWEASHNVDAPQDDDWSAGNPKREGRGEGPNHVGEFAGVKCRAVADGAFIAAAHNLLPALLARLDAERHRADAAERRANQWEGKAKAIHENRRAETARADAAEADADAAEAKLEPKDDDDRQRLLEIRNSAIRNGNREMNEAIKKAERHRRDDPFPFRTNTD